MNHKVSRRDNRLHLSVQVPHRIHCSRIYPFVAPNGSTIILYGYSSGIRVIWRGGTPRREASSLDSDASRPDGRAQHAEDETEQDGDQVYPDLIHAVDIELETEILSLAVPIIPSAGTTVPEFLGRRAVVAASNSEGKVALLSIPLEPPSSEGLHEYVASVKRSRLVLQDRGAGPSQLAIKLVAAGEDAAAGETADPHLLVAAASDSLRLWRLAILQNKVALPEQSPGRSTSLPARSSHLSFQASSRSNWLLLCDGLGAVRIFDPHGSSSADDADSNQPRDARGGAGECIMTYHSPWNVSKTGDGLVRRKRILDAAWVLGGRGILALLEDGEWGIWDVSGQSHAGKGVQDFAFGGFLDAASSSDAADTAQPKKPASKLAPMTPNTRRSKAEDLFSGPAKARRPALSGGASVSSTRSRSGQADDSAALWYGDAVFAIPSLHAFWQRSASAGSGVGSLYAPGLTLVGDVNLANEDITAISHFAARPGASALGAVHSGRDLLISAEYRLIILQAARPAARTRLPIDQPTAAERLPLREQRMLDAGELDLGGVDRMLDGMAGGARTRKVGFAAH